MTFVSQARSQAHVTMAIYAQTETTAKTAPACPEATSVIVRQTATVRKKNALNPLVREIHVNSLTMTPVTEITATISGHVPTGASVQTESRLASVTAFVPTLQTAQKSL